MQQPRLRAIHVKRCHTGLLKAQALRAKGFSPQVPILTRSHGSPTAGHREVEAALLGAATGVAAGTTASCLALRLLAALAARR